MSGGEEYSDDDSVIAGKDKNPNPSSSVLSVVGNTVSALARSAMNKIVGSSSLSQPVEPTSGEPIRPVRKGQMQYKIFKTKQVGSDEDNKSGIRSHIEGLGRGHPTPSGSSVQNEPPIVPGRPTLSDPTADSPKKCESKDCKGMIESNYQCNVCHEACQSKIFQRPYRMEPNGTASTASIPSPPKLKVESVEGRTPKRLRSSTESDVEEIPPPPVLKKEIVTETESPVVQQQLPKVIPETPPNQLEEELFLEAHELYFGNIKCNFKEIKVDGECLSFSAITPVEKAPDARVKFNIKIPFSEIRIIIHCLVTCYSNGCPPGHYIYVDTDPSSSSRIMDTMKSLIRIGYIFKTGGHEAVKYLFIRADQTFDLKTLRYSKLPKDVVWMDLSPHGNKKQYFAITTNSYKRSSNQAKRIPPIRGSYSTMRSPAPVLTRNRGVMTLSPIRSTGNSSSKLSKPQGTKSPTEIVMIELDDDEEEVQDGKRSTRSSSAAVAVADIKPKIDPDQMLFVFPPDDPSRVEIYGRDLLCLKPQEYLNDNIIDFYLQYVMINSISPEIRAKTHIFTTFFFTKLTEKKKDNSSEKDQSKRVYDRVKKWLRKVDVFSKDYLVIPVNRSHHWFLIIVCNANNVQDVDGSADVITIDKKSKEEMPCIVVMDSLGVVRTGGTNKLTQPIRYCLEEEWKNKKNSAKTFDHALIPDRNIKPPLQDNSFDCGLFLIKYVECFLKDPAKVLGAPINRLGKEFMDIRQAKNLRKVIEVTIHELWDRNKNSIVVESTSYVGDTPDDKSSLKILSFGEDGNGSSTPGNSCDSFKTAGGAWECEMEVIEEPAATDSAMITDDEDPISIEKNGASSKREQAGMKDHFK